MSEKLTLFDLFGGTRKMAEALDEPPSTVNSWKSAGRIPATKQPDVLVKAQELGLPVTAEDIIFPLGREDSGDGDAASATKGDEFIRDAGDVGRLGLGEAAPHQSPFSDPAAVTAASCPTCSPTSAPPQSPAANPTSSAVQEPKAA